MGLYQDVDDVAVLIHGTPEVLQLAVNSHEHFVQIPSIPQPTLASFQSPCILHPEFDRPLSDRFVRHVYSALSEQILDVPETQTESIIEPDSVTDNVWRKAVPHVPGSLRFH